MRTGADLLRYLNATDEATVRSDFMSGRYNDPRSHEIVQKYLNDKDRIEATARYKESLSIAKESLSSSKAAVRKAERANKLATIANVFAAIAIAIAAIPKIWPFVIKWLHKN